MREATHRFSTATAFRLKPEATHLGVVLLLLTMLSSPAVAEDGHAAWLRYAPVDAAARARISGLVPGVIVALGDAAPIASAREELARGIKGTLAKEVQ